MGLDGDSPSSEPAGATVDNSRLSDELYTVAYNESGSLSLTMYGDGDSWMGAFVASFEMDTDDDGIPDRRATSATCAPTPTKTAGAPRA